MLQVGRPYSANRSRSNWPTRPTRCAGNHETVCKRPPTSRRGWARLHRARLHRARCEPPRPRPTLRQLADFATRSEPSQRPSFAATNPTMRRSPPSTYVRSARDNGASYNSDPTFTSCLVPTEHILQQCFPGSQPTPSNCSAGRCAPSCGPAQAQAACSSSSRIDRAANGVRLAAAIAHVLRGTTRGHANPARRAEPGPPTTPGRPTSKDPPIRPHRCSE